MTRGRTVSILGAVLLLTPVAFAQSSKKVGATSAHWATTAVVSLQARNILPATKPGTTFEGNKPVTRYELAVVLWKLVQHFEAAAKQPRGKSTVKGDPDGARALRRLIADGYLAADSPIAKETTKGVGEEELAKVLVEVIARVQEKTVPVTPDSKKSIPMDRHPGGGS